MSIIETERLTIRHIVADDWKSIKEIWVDFNTSALSQYDMPHITDDDDVQPRIAKWAGANSGTEHMFFAICLGDIVIGYSAFAILFFVCGIIALIRGQGAPLWGIEWYAFIPFSFAAFIFASIFRISSIEIEKVEDRDYIQSLLDL